MEVYLCHFRILKIIQRAPLSQKPSISLCPMSNKDRQRGLLRLTDIAQRLMGDEFGSAVFDSARKLIENPDSKWMKFANQLLDEADPHVVKMHVLNAGYQAGFYGFSKTCDFAEKHGFRIPWIILMDPTSACNRRCTGCWSAEYGHKVSMSYEDLDRIVSQGEELGIYFYMMTGGEPLMRKKDIVKLAEKHRKSFFYAFTNGTLVDEAFCCEMQRLGNISLAVSVEGFEEQNDARRGQGCFQKAMDAMDLLKKHGLIFGTLHLLYGFELRDCHQRCVPRSPDRKGRALYLVFPLYAGRKQRLRRSAADA